MNPISLEDAMHTQYGLRPLKQDKGCPIYSAKDVNRTIFKLIETNSYFSKRVKNIMSDTKTAIDKTNEVINGFELVINKYMAMEESIVEKTKKTSGSIKDSAEKLAQGMARIEKAANFDRLERYVGLLERAATAMNLLAELEKDGKLDKIAGALK